MFDFILNSSNENNNSNYLKNEKSYLEFQIGENYKNFEKIEYSKKIDFEGAFILGKINAYEEIYFKFYP